MVRIVCNQVYKSYYQNSFKKTPDKIANTNCSKALVKYSDIPLNAFNHFAIQPNFRGNTTQIKETAGIAEKFSFDVLKKLLAKYDSDMDTALKKMISSTLEYNQEIGEGKWHKVFAIPDNETFVLRVNLGAKNIDGKLTPANPLFKDLNLGQPVAYIEGIDQFEHQILRKVDGNSIGVPYPIRKEAQNKHTIVNNRLIGEDLFLKHLEQISKIPQYAFDDLANTIKTLRNEDYVYDVKNANNIMLHKDDLKGYKFNIIDDLSRMDTLYRQFGNETWNGSVEDMALSLMDFNSNIIYADSPNIKQNELLQKQIQNYNKQILNKCLIAAFKEELPKPGTRSKIPEVFRMAGCDDSAWKNLEYNWYQVKSNLKAGKQVDFFNLPSPQKIRYC